MVGGDVAGVWNRPRQQGKERAKRVCKRTEEDDVGNRRDGSADKDWEEHETSYALVETMAGSEYDRVRLEQEVDNAVDEAGGKVSAAKRFNHHLDCIPHEQRDEEKHRLQRQHLEWLDENVLNPRLGTCVAPLERGIPPILAIVLPPALGLAREDFGTVCFGNADEDENETRSGEGEKNPEKVLPGLAGSTHEPRYHGLE